MSKFVNGMGVVRSEFKFDNLAKVVAGCWFAWSVAGLGLGWEDVLFFGVGGIVVNIVVVLKILSQSHQWVECNVEVIRVKSFWCRKVQSYPMNVVTRVRPRLTMDELQFGDMYEVWLGRWRKLILSSFYMSNVEELVAYLDECQEEEEE